MKITELDLRAEGKRYKCGNSIFKVKDGDLVDIESNTYLRKEDISITELLEMDFEEIDEMKNPYKQAGYGERYHCIYGYTIHLNTDSNHEIDNKLFSTANYFNNKEYAEYIAFKETLMRKLDKFAWENNARVIDWERNSKKYYITFDIDIKNLVVYWRVSHKSNDIYFTSKEIAKKALEKFKDDLVKLYTWKFDFLAEEKVGV